MSNDIRTSINGIIGMRLSFAKIRTTTRKRDCLHKIELSLSAAAAPGEGDVLDMAQLENGTVVLRRESMNLDEVCGSITNSELFRRKPPVWTVTGEHDDFFPVFTSAAVRCI